MKWKKDTMNLQGVWPRLRSGKEEPEGSRRWSMQVWLGGVQHRYGNLVSFLSPGSIQYTIVILSYLKSGRARPDGVQVLIDTGRARRVQHRFSSLVFLSGSVTIQDAVIKFHEILIIDYHFVWAAFFVTGVLFESWKNWKCHCQFITSKFLVYP